MNELESQADSSDGVRMCNGYRLEVDLASIVEDFDDLKIKIEFSEGAPNFAPRADVRITDPGVIVRTGGGGRGFGDLVQRRWSWPSQNGAPVFNFRSEDRDFKNGRCLIVTDGFYEFTKPADPTRKLKDKWLFTRPRERLLCIAGIWRKHPQVGEAFTMLTTEPGPDLIGVHSRQIAVLEPAHWAHWLDPDIPAAEILARLPVGGLKREPVLTPPPEA